MGAICGILDHAGGASMADLHAMLFMLSHRGIGSPGALASGPVALGHWDLGTLEVERRVEQPCQDKSGGLCMVFDGRLDNRVRLLSDLRLDQGSDAEIALAAYVRWGDEAWARLLGDFALALWDPEGAGLSLVRDPIGVRPLFYAPTPARLLFASEAKAMLALRDVPRAPDPERWRELERFRFRLRDETFFDGILRVMPGHRLSVHGRRVELRRFWYPRTAHAIPRSDPEEYYSEFRGLFMDAVRDRLPARGSAALMLSGGLDSPSIAAAASHTHGLRRPDSPLLVDAYTMLWRDGADERRLSRLAADRAGLRISPVYLDDVNIEPTAAIAFQHETPLLNPIDLVHDHLYRIAAADGHKILLSGEWGDDLLHGGAFLADLLRSGRWKEFWKHVIGFRKQEAVPIHAMLYHLLGFLLLPRRDTPKFPLHAQEQVYEAVFVPLKLMAMENMERGAAAYGIDLRLPFLDLRIVEFLFRIPGELLADEGVGKQLLRKGLADLLPEEIARRTLKDNTPLFRPPPGAGGGRDGNLSAFLSDWTERELREWKSAWFGV